MFPSRGIDLPVATVYFVVCTLQDNNQLVERKYYVQVALKSKGTAPVE